MEEKAHDKKSTLFPHGNYFFLNLEFQRSQYINAWKLFKGGNYSREKTIQGLYYMRKYGKYFLRRDSLGKCSLSSMHRPL